MPEKERCNKLLTKDHTKQGFVEIIPDTSETISGCLRIETALVGQLSTVPA